MLHTVHTSVHTTAPLHLTHLHYPSWCNILISTQFHLFEHSSHLLRIRDNWKTTACLCLSMLLKQLQVSRSGRQRHAAWCMSQRSDKWSVQYEMGSFPFIPPLQKKKEKKKCLYLKPACREAGRLDLWMLQLCGTSSYVVQASTIQGTLWIWILPSIPLFNTLRLLLCVAVIVFYPRCFPTHNRKHNWHKTVHGNIQTDRLAFVIYPAHSCTYRKCSIYKMKAESSTDSA